MAGLYMRQWRKPTLEAFINRVSKADGCGADGGRCKVGGSGRRRHEQWRACGRGNNQARRQGVAAEVVEGQRLHVGGMRRAGELRGACMGEG